MSADTVGYPPFDTLKPVAEGLWVVDAEPMSIMGIALPIRMTVVRLSDGTLWLCSPTRFSPALATRLNEIGPVRHLVAPSMGHWTFMEKWQEHFPEAKTWAVPKLRNRRQVKASNLRLDHDLDDTPPAAWAEELQQVIVPGGGGFREADFLHLPSRTAILTDLISNLEPERISTATGVYARLTGTRAPNGSTPGYLRAALRLRKKDAAAACARLVAWEPDRVIFAHGRWFESDGSRQLKRALGWLVDGE